MGLFISYVLCFCIFLKLFLEPILAVDIAFNNEGGNVVACGVDHGCGRIDQITQSKSNGEGNCQLVGEEDGAENKLSCTATSGDTAHSNGGEYCDNDSENDLSGSGINAEEAEEEQNLDDSAHCGAVHVHCCAHGENNIGDFLGNAGFLSNFHVGGDCCNRGAGAEGNCCGTEQVLEHNLCTTLAAAEACIDGEENEHVCEAYEVVNDEGSAVLADEVGTVCSNQRSEETEEADRRVVGNYLHHLHDAVGYIVKDLCGEGFFTAGRLNAEAEENCKNDKGKNCSAAEKLGKVGLGEEVDNHVCKAETGNLNALLNYLLVGDGEDEYNNVHEYCCDCGGYEEGTDGNAHDLACALCAVCISNCGGNGEKDQRNNDTEHQVDKDRSQRLKIAAESRIYPTDYAAGDNACKHENYKSVSLKERFLFHNSKAPYKIMCSHYILIKMPCKLIIVLDNLQKVR